MIQTANSRRNARDKGSQAASGFLALAPALWAVLSLSLAACQIEESGAAADSLSAQAPGGESSTTRPAKKSFTPFPARGDVSFFAGSTRFHAPRDVVGFQVGDDGDRVNFVTLGV